MSDKENGDKKVVKLVGKKTQERGDLGEVDRSAVKLLEEYLEAAKAGEFQSVVVIICNDDEANSAHNVHEEHVDGVMAELFAEQVTVNELRESLRG